MFKGCAYRQFENGWDEAVKDTAKLKVFPVEESRRQLVFLIRDSINSKQQPLRTTNVVKHARYKLMVTAQRWSLISSIRLIIETATALILLRI